MPGVEERGPRGGGGAGAGRRRAAAPRRPVHDQGLVRHRGGPDDTGLGPVRGPRARARRSGDHAAGRGGRHPARQDEPAGLRALVGDRQPRLRAHAQPVGSRAQRRRLERGRGRGDGGRPVAARYRKRPGRVGPTSGALLRCRRPETDAWSRSGDRPLAGHAAALHARRLPGAIGRGRRARAVADGRRRRRGSVRPAGAGSPAPRGRPPASQGFASGS